MNGTVDVIAVVVTHNRKKLLLRCLRAIFFQTSKVTKVIVIDNASSDGSKDFIFATNELSEEERQKILWFTLEKNLGGAGGFSLGVEKAFALNSDFLWLMDDDGYPSENCLSELLRFASDFSFISPVVLSDKDKNSLSFPLRLRGSLKILENLADVRGLESNIIQGVVAPFNGTLISSDLIARIGYPDKNFFIWGDEVDYTERARAAGAKIFTVSNSLYFHPKGQNVGNPMFFGLVRFNEPNSQIKLYCYCRNNVYNLRRYSGVIKAALFTIKVLWYYTLTKFNKKGLSIAFRGLKDGISGNFQNHLNYISSV